MLDVLRKRTAREERPIDWHLLLTRPNWWALSTFFIPFLLYLLTLAPTIYNLDSAELTTAVATDGIIRATGYPLYLLLGKLFAWLPVGDMGYRLNLFSAVCGALTICLADRILQRLAVGRWARLGALGLLATAPYFWAMSLIAEVYTLHTALMATIILLLLRWDESPTAPRLAALALALGLSLGNHAATVLLVPGCAWFVATRGRRHWFRPRLLAAVVLAGLAGLAVYLLLPWRSGQNPVFNYAGMYDATGAFAPVDLQTWQGLWWLVSGKSFAGQMFGYRLAELGPEIGGFVAQLWLAFFAVGVGPGLWGLIVALRRDRRLSVLLLLFFLANAIFYVNYRVVDKASMYLPAYLVWALWLGIGYQSILDLFHEAAGWRRWVWLPRLVMAGAVLLAVAWNWSRVDLSDDWSTREQSEAILQEARPNAIIFGWWDTVPALQYLQLVEGQRPDVTLINRFLISGADMNRLIERELGRRPIYLDNPSIDLLRQSRATVAGPLYLLEPRDAGCGAMAAPDPNRQPLDCPHEGGDEASLK
jgi:4-amino-4-deoxy-L-arabinose transferase-like glycosyltransferase